MNVISRYNIFVSIALIIWILTNIAGTHLHFSLNKHIFSISIENDSLEYAAPHVAHDGDDSIDDDLDDDDFAVDFFKTFSIDLSLLVVASLLIILIIHRGSVKNTLAVSLLSGILFPLPCPPLRAPPVIA